jgi:hypothetical protein
MMMVASSIIFRELGQLPASKQKEVKSKLKVLFGIKEGNTHDWAHRTGFVTKPLSRLPLALLGYDVPHGGEANSSHNQPSSHIVPLWDLGRAGG